MFVEDAPSSRAVAQPNARWQEIWQIPKIDGFSITGYCGYFFNKHHGLIGASRLWKGTATASASNGTTAANDAYIFYTEDGSNWYQATTPDQGDSTSRGRDAHVTQIRMLDSLRAGHRFCSYDDRAQGQHRSLPIDESASIRFHLDMSGARFFSYDSEYRL